MKLTNEEKDRNFEKLYTLYQKCKLENDPYPLQEFLNENGLDDKIVYTEKEYCDYIREEIEAHDLKNDNDVYHLTWFMQNVASDRAADTYIRIGDEGDDDTHFEPFYNCIYEVYDLTFHKLCESGVI